MLEIVIKFNQSTLCGSGALILNIDMENLIRAIIKETGFERLLNFFGFQLKDKWRS